MTKSCDFKGAIYGYCWQLCVGNQIWPITADMHL